MRAELDRARFGRELAEQQFEQRGLAAAVRADDADLVAAPDGGGEIAHDRRAAVAEGDVLRLDHLLAGHAAGLDFDARGAFALAALAAFLAHRLQRADAALVAGAAGLHALAQPRFLLRELLVEGGPLLFLGLEVRGLALEVGVVIAGPARELAAVELDDAGGELAQEGAVVRDEEEGDLRVEQELLEPEDRVEIEVIGRLVEQQDVGLAGQRAGQQHAALQSAGERGEFVRRAGRPISAARSSSAHVGLPFLLVAVGAQAGVDDVHAPCR